MFALASRPYLSSGIIERLDEFLSAEDRAAGKSPARRLRDGVPVSSVEIFMQIENFGKKQTQVFRVEVPDSAIKISGPGQVMFEGLTVKPWVRNGSSIVQYSFRANSVRSATDEDLKVVDSGELEIF